jgi:hypothetical protein
LATKRVFLGRWARLVGRIEGRLSQMPLRNFLSTENSRFSPPFPITPWNRDPPLITTDAPMHGLHVHVRHVAWFAVLDVWGAWELSHASMQACKQGAKGHCSAHAARMLTVCIPLESPMNARAFRRHVYLKRTCQTHEPTPEATCVVLECRTGSTCVVSRHGTYSMRASRRYPRHLQRRRGRQDIASGSLACMQACKHGLAFLVIALRRLVR